MKTQRLQTRGAIIMGAALLVFTASITHAYDTTWRKSQCDSYSAGGLGHNYSFGADCGWIVGTPLGAAPNYAECSTGCTSSNEGVDCSSYVPRCWATDGPSDSYLATHACGNHPYSTYDYFPGNVPHTIAVSQSSLQSWDLWVYDYTEPGGCGSGQHMGLAKSTDASNIYTREARGSAYGIVEVTRSKQSLTDTCARYYRRDAWGAEPSSVIVDNSDAGFTASANWATGTSSTDKYGSSYRYHSTVASSDAATWVGGITAGTHAVYAWWPQGANRSVTAPYIVYHGTTSTTVNVNQQINGGKWNLLGSWSDFASGNNSVKLSCWTSTGFVVMADAIKWQ